MSLPTCGRWIAAGAVVSLALSAARAAAEVTIDRVAVGIQGYCKVGDWAPVVVEATTSAPASLQLEVVAPDPYGNPTVLPATPLDCAAGKHRLRGRLRAGRLDGRVAVRIRAGGEVVATREASFAERPLLRQSAALIATLGDPQGFDFATDDPVGPIRIAELAQTELPRDRLDYDALDAVVIAGDYRLSAAQSDALREWVLDGGHLVLSVGRGAAEYAAGPLPEWIPIAVDDEPMTIRDVSGLERLSGRNVRIRFAGSVPAARVTEHGGVALVSSFDSPLLVRAPCGLGRVTFLALDLTAPPLTAWEPLSDVCREITLDRWSEAEPLVRGRQLGHTGITDLATQLHATQDQFDNVRRYSLWTVMFLMIVYLLVIGPLDFLLVHRVLQRPQWTWISLPAMVALAASLSVWSGGLLNGDRLLVNQLDVIDVAPVDGAANGAVHVRARNWATIYSPATRRYEVSLEPRSLDAEGAGKIPTDVQLGWAGIPENVFGGMYRLSGIELGRAPYWLSGSAGRIDDLPLRHWSTQPLQASWSTSASSPIESDLEGAGVGRLSGTIRNRLPAPLEDWLIAYGRQVYLPQAGRRGTEAVPLAPGATWQPNGRFVYQRELKHYLTKTTARQVDRRPGQRGERIVTEQTEYDALSLDQAELLRILTFHGVTGARNYTGLHNYQLAELDLSGELELGRAVLFARIGQPVAGVAIDGRPQEPARHNTFLRIVLPVHRLEGVVPLQKLIDD